jgi:hypothetical protein
MSVVDHPKRAAMLEAARERELADSPEAQPLLEAIFKAVRAYSDFLERHNMIWDDECEGVEHYGPQLMAQALVVTLDYGDGDFAVDITLKDGPLDRVYGNGANPDPEGREA